MWTPDQCHREVWSIAKPWAIAGDVFNVSDGEKPCST